MSKKRESKLAPPMEHRFDADLMCGCGVDWAQHRKQRERCALGLYRVVVELDGLPAMNTARNKHWRVKRKHDLLWQERVAAALVGKLPPEPLATAVVRVTRFSSVEPDYDNLVQSAKPLIDQFVRSGVLVDDKPSVIGAPIYDWVKVAPRKGRVRIEIGT